MFLVWPFLIGIGAAPRKAGRRACARYPARLAQREAVRGGESMRDSAPLVDYAIWWA